MDMPYRDKESCGVFVRFRATSNSRVTFLVIALMPKPWLLDYQNEIMQEILKWKILKLFGTQSSRR
jgi:hypothetical protein